MGLANAGLPVIGSPEHRLSHDEKPTLFSFGYWGAGSATRPLVDAVNEGEALRGFKAPLWVDIRISRSVRAAGFRDHAFERLLGPSHYVWMRDLGNICVRERRPGVEIQSPAAAEDLLNHALSAPERRVIFFCSCMVPGECHRYVVATLVKDAARRRGIDVGVVEWPGGEPSTLTIDVKMAVFRAVSRGGQSTLALPHGMNLGAAAVVPWGTLATLKAGSEIISVLVGPALFTGRGAHLPILFIEPPSGEAASLREKAGYEYLA